MDVKKLVYLMVICGTLTACGGGSDGGASNKDLFSKWTSAADGSTYDLTGAQFNVQFQLTIPYAVNVGVFYDFTVTGTEDSGSFYLANCTHYGPTNYCVAGTTQYNYTKSGATLTVCDGWGANCEVFR